MVKNKKSEELNNLINKDIKTGKLLKIYYSDGNKEERKIEIDIYNSIIIEEYNLNKTEYKINKSDINKLKRYIKKYNFPAWSNLPMGDLLALDAPSKELILYYDNSKYGGNYLDFYKINFYSRIPKDGYIYLNRFIEKMYEIKEKNNR